MTSDMACMRHLTSSVGQSTRDEKNEAQDPDMAFWSEVNSVSFLTPDRSTHCLLTQSIAHEQDGTLPADGCQGGDRAFKQTPHTFSPHCVS